MNRILGWTLGDCIFRFVDENNVTKETNEDSCIYKNVLWMNSNGTIHVSHDSTEYVFSMTAESSDVLAVGDVLSVSQNGTINILFSAGDKEVDIFVTNKCNSNCIMCPLAESVRRRNQNGHGEWIKDYIRALPQDISYINITGGEPTLSNDFMDIMKLLRNKFDHSEFQLLTNGRSFSDDVFLKHVLDESPRRMHFAIPIHSSNAEEHDGITRSKNSFIQTDWGIKNLVADGQTVDLRIVISKKNADSLVETAKYIVNNYAGVACIDFIGMEMMGNAALNKDALWLDYNDAFQKAKDAINVLVNAGFDTQLFNFPLCAIDRGYWHIAAKSITEYKIRYMNECDRCSVKEICGGFFYSTKQVINPKVRPIVDS